MGETHLAIIEQLITENETVKEQNLKLTILCEDLLSGIVDLMSDLMPSVEKFDSDNIFSASENIFNYYRKQFLLVKADINLNMIQILNLYGIEQDIDLSDQSINSLNSFFEAMRSGRGNLKNQLNHKQKQIKQLQENIGQLQKQINRKQLQIQKLANQLSLKQTDIDTLKTDVQLLQMDKRSLSQKLERVIEQCQRKNNQLQSFQTEISYLKNQNQNMRRQFLTLEAQKVQRSFRYE